MEKHSLLRALFLASIITTAIALNSCRTQTVVLPSSHTRDSLHFSVYTRADSIREYVRDSMSIRFGKVSSAGGNGIPDTVYIDRWHTAYKDRWRVNARVDTITIIKTDTVSVAIPCPSWGKGADRRERGYIPRFYKNCTLGFFLLLLAILAYIALRIYLRR